MLTGPWRTFAGLFAESRRRLAWSTVTSILQSALLIPIAILVQRIFAQMNRHGRTDRLLIDGGLILMLYLASAGVGLWTRRIVLSATRAAIIRLRAELLERIYSLPQSYFDQQRLTRLHSTIVQDSQLLDTAASVLAGQLLPALIASVALAAVLVVENAVLFGVLVAVVPVLFLVGSLLGRRVKSRTRTWREAFDAFSAQTHLAVRGITLTKVHGAEELELTRRRSQIADLGRTAQAMTWLHSAYGLIQNSVSAAAGVVVLIVGGVAVQAGSMSLGQLLAFYAILALLLRQLNLVVGAVPYVLEASVPLERVEAIRGAERPDPYTGTRQITFEGSLQFDGVAFSYGSEPVLRGVSLVIEPGERVAIVGPNGAGKSTMVGLMLGLYRPGSGRVLADGVPFDELALRALRREIGVVLQNPLIFPGTIAENIGYGRPKASAEEIRQAARSATADRFIEDLPQGYDTEVGDEGALLSGGQRQRIAVARALIGRPRLLILDEPTTHLDDATISALMASLRTLPGAPGIVMITHDGDLAREADVIYQLRDGAIVTAERPHAGDAAVGTL